MKNNFIFLFLTALILNGCIGDDFILDEVHPVLTITTNVDTIEIGTTFQFEAKYFDNVGQEREVLFSWFSSDESIVGIESDGLAFANELGEATITVDYNDGNNTISDSRTIVVGDYTVSSLQTVSGNIVTTSSYVLEGDFDFNETEAGVELILKDNYQASSSLPGLYVYLSNNKNSVADAYEIGGVNTFSGAHEYNITGVGFNDFQYIVYFCKPFNVKVGEGSF